MPFASFSAAYDDASRDDDDDDERRDSRATEWRNSAVSRAIEPNTNRLVRSRRQREQLARRRAAKRSTSPPPSRRPYCRTNVSTITRPIADERRPAPFTDANRRVVRVSASEANRAPSNRRRSRVRERAERRIASDKHNRLSFRCCFIVTTWSDRAATISEV